MATYMLKFILFWFGVFMVGTITWFLRNQYKEWKSAKKFEESKYKLMYEHITAFIDKEPCQMYRNKIEKDLETLRKLKYKNPEMTQVLSERFWKKYKEFNKVEEVELINTAV